MYKLITNRNWNKYFSETKAQSLKHTRNSGKPINEKYTFNNKVNTMSFMLSPKKTGFHISL